MTYYRIVRRKTDGSSIAVGLDSLGRPGYVVNILNALEFVKARDATVYKHHCEEVLDKLQGQLNFEVIKIED